MIYDLIRESNLIAVAAVAITPFIALAILPYVKRSTYYVIITGKEHISESSSSGSISSYYLVYTRLTDGTAKVFTNKDDLLLSKVGSAEIQADLDIGATYCISVYGYRVPLLSWYENIIGYEKVK